ncbi:MAG: hypothetical protein EA356_18090 [Geminicoccaceae bacterium]|nr:MAG: hypothetical protein EA356_18090 [Geminicoccaceae bacterium]
MRGSEADRERKAIGADLVIPLLALAFALYFFSSIWNLVWEAKANGVVIGTILLVLVGIQLGRSFWGVWQGRYRLGFDDLIEPSGALFRRIALVSLLVLFVATFHLVGTVAGLILGMGSMMFVLGQRDWRWLIGLPSIIALTIHLLFVVFLGARLPAGPIEQGIRLLIGG